MFYGRTDGHCWPFVNLRGDVGCHEHKPAQRHHGSYKRSIVHNTGDEHRFRHLTG